MQTQIYRNGIDKIYGMSKDLNLLKPNKYCDSILIIKICNCKCSTYKRKSQMNWNFKVVATYENYVGSSISASNLKRKHFLRI